MKILSKDERWKILLEMKEILDSLSIPFFLTCGTALGAIREPDGFVEEDNDVDLGILEDYENRIPEIKEEAEKRGWIVEIWYDSCLKGKGKIISFFKDEHECVDIGVYYKSNDKYWHCINFGQCEKEFFPSSFFEKMEKVKIREVEFNIPSPSEKYVEYLYGGDWRTPIGLEEYLERLRQTHKRH